VDSERFRKIQSVFEAALDHSGPGRTAFLKKACRGDLSLLQEVERLLQADEKTHSLLDRDFYRKASEPAQETAPPTLPLGTLLCARYQITRVIGHGGMGAVYQAEDSELSSKGANPIAIKVILPAYSERSDLRRRFKEEISLARRIAHRNVVRIFNLEIDGNLLFLTMEFVDGEDLASLLRRQGALPARQAAEIIYQAALGIEAAHQSHVIHRDIKTRNMMIQPDGRVVVTDFGLARPLGGESRTETAGFVGTFAYMAPEQLRLQKSDERADLYSLGVVFHELLTGELPPGPVTGEKKKDFLSSVLPNRSAASSIGPADRRLTQIVRQCLADNPDNRYQTATELRESIGNWLQPAASKKAVARWQIGAAASALLAILLGVWAITRHSNTPAPHPPVTLLIADLVNRTGDAVFSGGTLESVLAIELERSPFISSFSRDAAHNAAKQLRGSSDLTEAVAHEVAVREGIQNVIAGSLERQGSDYVLEVHASDADGIGSPVSRRATAGSRDAVLSTLSQLATDIRRGLGESTPPPQRAETFTSSSLDAIHSYQVAQGFALEGKRDEAIAEYRHAILLDPDLGRAYAGLAVLYRNKNQIDEALKYYGDALKHVDRMTDREKYRTRGGYYITSGSPDKAIDEYNQLVKEFPADSAGLANLALAWFLKGDMAKATEYGQKIVNIYPKNVAQRTNLAWYLLFDGKFPDSVIQARQALQYNPKFAKAYIVVALATLAQGDVPGAKSAYNDLQRVSDEGASAGSLGLADIAAYEGRMDDATNLLRAGAAADQATDNKPAAAVKLATLATTELLDGNKDKALAAAHQADALGSKTDNVLFQLAQVYIKLSPAKALEIATQMLQSSKPDKRCYGMLIKGELSLENQHAAEAVTTFEEALKQRDFWLARYDMGRAYLSAGKFPEADGELEACIRRRGEAAAVFMDDLPSYRVFPPVYYLHGLAEEGLGASGAKWYEMFLAIKTGNSIDPMVADARHHLSTGK